MSQKVNDLEGRSHELSDFIKIQENMLDDGAARLANLNNEFNILDKEYKILLSKKSQLAQDIQVMAANLNLFSDD